VAYLLGVICFLLRLSVALWGGQRLRATAIPLADSALLEQIRNQASRIGLGIFPIVAYCERVAVPTVIGVLRPIVLLPASVMTGLTADEFSAIISHEFAHIRRYDLWMNLLQRLIESLLFFHPVVWLLSRSLSTEREICCDDLVVRSGHEAMKYAGALLRMAELCAGVSSQNSLAIAATTGGPTLLEHRVLRLIQASPSTRLNLNRKALFLLGSTVLLAVALLHSINQQSSQLSLNDSAEVTVTGRIEWEDGTLVTKKGSIRVISRSGFASSGPIIYLDVEGGHFARKCSAGKISVTAFVDGYAPAWTDEFELTNGRKKNLVIVLTTGAKRTMRVVGEDDNPVAGATLVMLPEIHGEASSLIVEYKTDDQGLLTMEHLADAPYEFRINAPGFQTLRTRPLNMSVDEELVHVLKRCRLATGWIYNHDGTPAFNAQVLKSLEVVPKSATSTAGYYSSNSGEDRGFGKQIAVANEDGRYEIDQLNDDSRYLFVIQGSDGSRVVLFDLIAGQTDREITLSERRDLIITITGDTSSLPKRDGRPFISIRQRFLLRTTNGQFFYDLLGENIPLELHATGGSAVFRGLIMDPASEAKFAETEVSLRNSEEWKKIVQINPAGNTEVDFELPPANSHAIESHKDDNAKSVDSADIPIQDPHRNRIVENENLQGNPQVDGIAVLNRTSQESSTGEFQSPISEPTEHVVTDIRIEGNSSIPTESIMRKIKSDQREPLSEESIRENCRILMKSRLFFSVTTRLEETPNGMTLVYVVHERPMTQKVEFRGHRRLSQEQLENIVGANAKAGSPFDHVDNREMAKRIQQTYQQQGFGFAKVQLLKGGSKEDREIIFEIEEGPRVDVCMPNVSNLGTRLLSKAITNFKQTSQESSSGILQRPITEQETRDAIAKFAAEGPVPEAVRAQLNEILRSGSLPSNAYFRRFTRFDDGKQMQAVWWVRLVVQPSDGGVFSAPVRTTAISSRPYTQMERQQNAADGMTLIGRVSSYYENPPVKIEQKPLDKAMVDRLATRSETALKGKDFDALKALFEPIDGEHKVGEFAESELKTLLNAKIHSVKVTPRTLEGNLITWSAWQKYKPNLPVVGYLEIEYSEEMQRKMLMLELGRVGDELKLVNYVPDGDRKPPESLNPGPSITGHLEQLADGTFLLTDIITNPGTLLSAHLANEEIRLRDFQKE